MMHAPILSPDPKASAWDELEHCTASLCPTAASAEVRDVIQAARSAGLDPADFSGAVWGTQAAGRLGMPTGLTLIFGDWEAGDYATARVSGVARFTRDADGWNAGGAGKA